MEQAKKDTILDAAKKLFSHFGYKKTSMDDVAKEAGVAKGTVYLAASSKSDLLYQTILRLLRNCMYTMGHVIDPQFPADEMLPRMIELELAHLQNEPLLQELLLGGVGTSGWSQRFDELRRMARNNHVEVLKLGQRQGIFREDIDPDTVAIIIQDLEAASFLFHRNETHTDSKLWQTALQLVLDGLKPQTQ